MADERLDIYFSYARADSRFVDRLDADLRARGYKTWIDRRKLEASQDWQAEIDAAIVRCDLFLISLSPKAVISTPVRREFEKALERSKRLMPIIYENCTIPAWMSAVDGTHWQGFTKDSDYALNLKELLYAIQFPSLPQGASTGQLYDEALTLRSSEHNSDRERAAILFQHIVDTNPTYFNGRPQRDLADLEAQLYSTRIALLSHSAVEARQRGEYGAEAASLKALMDLGDRDTTAYEWAKEYLAVAEVNREMLEPYDNAQSAYQRGDMSTAQSLLRDVWLDAPRFRDPASVAPKLGLEGEMPPTYEQAKAADAECERLKRACTALEGRFEDLRRKFPSDNGSVPDYPVKSLESLWSPASTDLPSDDRFFGLPAPALDFSLDTANSSLRQQNYELAQPAAQEALAQLVANLHASNHLLELATTEPLESIAANGCMELVLVPWRLIFALPRALNFIDSLSDAGAVIVWIVFGGIVAGIIAWGVNNGGQYGGLFHIVIQIVIQVGLWVGKLLLALGLATGCAYIARMVVEFRQRQRTRASVE